MTNLSDDERWQQWRTWFRLASDDVSALFHHRHVWKNLIAMLGSNPDVEHHAVVNDWLTRGYSQTIAVGIRRQWDSTKRRPTIGCLLEEMVKHPHVLTIERYLAQTDEDPVTPAVLYGWLAYASPDRKHLDPNEVAISQQVFNDGTKIARDWTNRGVTHRDKDTITNAVTLAFSDLDESLNIVGALIQRYFGLFNPGSSLHSVTPYMPLTWTNMFAVPWLNDGFQPVDPASLG